MDRYCTTCGARVIEGASFCGVCGSSVSGDVTPPREPQTQDAASKEGALANPAPWKQRPSVPSEESSPNGDGALDQSVPEQNERSSRTGVRRWLIAPFLWVENRVMEPFSRWLAGLAFLDILEYLGKLAILVVLLLWLWHWDDRSTAEHYEAWRVINSAQGQEGTGGRIDAMQNLYEKNQSMAGLTADGANLAGIDLHDFLNGRANLDSASLQGTDLSGADLRKANMWNARMRGAQLPKYYEKKINGETEEEGRRADLSGAVLDQADLRDADLRGANLTGAQLNEANLDGAYLDGADLDSSEFVGKTDIRRATFAEASLRDADLQNAILGGEYVNFHQAVLQNANLRGTDLSGADLSGANLRGADLRETKVSQELIDQATGDSATQLPDGLQRPQWWKQAVEPLTEAPLAAGRFNTGLFSPTLSFTVGEGWRVATAETEDSLSIERDSRIYFSNVTEVFEPTGEVLDPQDPTQPNASPAPDDLVSWIEDHPHLNVTKEKEVDIGGLTGTQLDVEVTSAPEDYPVTCYGPCVALFPNTDYYYEDNFYRFVVSDVGPDQIFISINSLNDPRAQKVLASVTWSNYELPAGENISSVLLRPEMTLTPGPGWRPYRQQSDIWSFTSGSSTLSVVRVEEVYDPHSSTGESVSTPDNLVSWFEDHPYLKVTNKEKAPQVGGTQFDVEVSSAPEDYPKECGRLPCLAVFDMGDSGPFWFYDDYENHVLVLQVDGEMVVVSMESPFGEAQAFMPRADELVRTVEWKD